MELYGPPKYFWRPTIAKICKAIGKSTMQEKWILLLKMLKEEDPEYFGDTPTPRVPSYALVQEVTRLFLRSLAPWRQCKDIDIPSRLKELGIKACVPLHYGKRRRKSYPHNHMIRRFLWQIQLWSQERMAQGKPEEEDAEFCTCFDVFDPTVKRVSANIEVVQDVIYKEMCTNMNDGV